MARTLALLYTVAGLIPTFQQLCKEILPETNCFNVLDESLLKNTIRDGRLMPATARRAIGYIAGAEEAGADAVLVTCSSIGRAAEQARALVEVPVIRVDEAMADQAVRQGTRIGVIATLPTTLEPTAALIAARAQAAQRSVQVVSHLCDGAFAALGRGDTARHDALVAEGLRRLAGEVDVIVLAQASMARVADALPPAERPVPILTSPRSGVERAGEVLRSLV